MEDKNTPMTVTDQIKKTEFSSILKKRWHNLENQRVVGEEGFNQVLEKQTESSVIQNEDFNELKKRSYFLQNEVDRLWDLIAYIAMSKDEGQKEAISRSFKNR